MTGDVWERFAAMERRMERRADAARRPAGSGAGESPKDEGRMRIEGRSPGTCGVELDTQMCESAVGFRVTRRNEAPGAASRSRGLKPEDSATCPDDDMRSEDEEVR
jgi:hypothetical protein